MATLRSRCKTLCDGKDFFGVRDPDYIKEYYINDDIGKLSHYYFGLFSLLGLPTEHAKCCASVFSLFFFF